MLHKLALLLFAIHSAAIAIPTPEHTPSFSSPANQIHDKRFYYPETLPDEDELEVLLIEKSMRETGFVSTSSASSSPQSVQLAPKQKLHKSRPDPDVPNPVPMHPSSVYLEYLDSESHDMGHSDVIPYRSDYASAMCLPFGIFVVCSVFVCFLTITRGVLAKT